jgi:hypothetical protein
MMRVWSNPVWSMDGFDVGGWLPATPNAKDILVAQENVQVRENAVQQ